MGGLEPPMTMVGLNRKRFGNTVKISTAPSSKAHSRAYSPRPFVEGV
jgi:hypothetical protein